MTIDLPANVALSDTSWSVCFNPRGLADSNVTITITYAGGGSQDIEVMLGGAVRIVG